GRIRPGWGRSNSVGRHSPVGRLDAGPSARARLHEEPPSLSWFRKKQKNAEAAPSDASPQQAPEPPSQPAATATPPAETAESTDPTAEASAEAARKRRRRG